MKVFILAILIASTYAQAPTTTKFQCLRDILNLGPSTSKKGIAVRGSYEIKTILTLFDNMPSSVKSKIKTCGLNLKPALARCEASYGKGACSQLSPAAFQTKCDKYFKRVGCCHCAMECPAGYKEDDYHCIKPGMKVVKTYKDESKCRKAHKKCEQRGEFWTEECGFGFKRIGVEKCMPICPFGWHDEGKRCRKPADYRMAQPFLWQKGDK